MSDERQAWMDALIDTLITEALDERGDLAPPWARYPDITSGSIGWRMGAGDSWLTMWWRWMGRQPTDRAWRLAYLQRHPPAPRTWQGLALSVFDPTFEDDGGTDVEDAVADEARRLALLHELEQAGVVGDDLAIIAWDLTRGASRVPPFSLDYGGHRPPIVVRVTSDEVRGVAGTGGQRERPRSLGDRMGRDGDHFVAASARASSDTPAATIGVSSNGSSMP